MPSLSGGVKGNKHFILDDIYREADTAVGWQGRCCALNVKPVAGGGVLGPEPGFHTTSTGQVNVKLVAGGVLSPESGFHTTSTGQVAWPPAGQACKKPSSASSKSSSFISL